MKNKLLIPIRVIIVSFLFSAFFALAFAHPLYEDDASQYDQAGWNIASRNGFSLSQSQPFTPTMSREPLYPFFLAVIYKIFGHNHSSVRLFQIIIFCLTCLLVYDLAKETFDERIAKYSAFLTALSPTLANYASYLLTETIFTFLLCLTVLLLTKSMKKRLTGYFFISGITLGLSIICKAALLPFFIIAALGIFLSDKNYADLLRRQAIHAIVFILGILIVVTPWSLRNHHIFGTYQISLRGGAALWEMSQKLNDSAEDIKHEMVFNFSEYLGSKMFPGLVENPRDFILQGSKKSHEKERELEKRGLTPVEIDAMMKREAVEKITLQPIKFLIHIPVEFIKMTAFVYVPSLNEPYLTARFSKFKKGPLMLSSIRAIFRLSAYPILILVVIGILSARRSWRNWYFLLAVIIYINLIYSMLFAMGRYAVPLIPFYSIFAAVGFLRLLNRRATDI